MYLQHGTLDDTHHRVVQLSVDLNALDIHAERPDAEKWRNPNGANLKLANFAYLDRAYPGRGMSAGSKLEAAVFQRLAPYPDLVALLADEVRSGRRFTLDTLPLGDTATTTSPSDAASSTGTAASFGPVEQHHASGKTTVNPPAQPVETERVEQPLVHSFCTVLDEGGYSYGRRTYRVDGVEYRTNLVVPDVSLLIEAKANMRRDTLRMAGGQAKDYALMHEDAREEPCAE